MKANSVKKQNNTAPKPFNKPKADNSLSVGGQQTGEASQGDQAPKKIILVNYDIIMVEN